MAALGGLVRYLTFPCARVWELCRDKYVWKRLSLVSIRRKN
jgi:hypothetical protein